MPFGSLRSHLGADERRSENRQMVLDMENQEMEDAEDKEDTSGLPPIDEENRSRLLRAIDGEGSMSGAFSLSISS